MEYERHIRNNQVQRAKDLLKKMDPETFKKGPNDVTRFIKRSNKKKDGPDADRYVIDEEKIAEEEKYDGYYAVAANSTRTKVKVKMISIRSIISLSKKI